MLGWAKQIEETQDHAPNFPMIGDPTRTTSELHDMLPEPAGESGAGRMAAEDQTVNRTSSAPAKINLSLIYR